jgi:nucleotide-binding universal stress UspA family protein
MKKILVPTDFSECAEHATDIAITIADKAKAEIYFLHLHAPEPASGHMAMHGGGESHNGHHHHDCTGPARAQLDRLIKKAEHLGLSAKPVLVMNENWGQIEKHVRAFAIDLVVMGSHKVIGIKRFFIRSNAQRLIHSHSVPALIVSEGSQNFNPQRIVFVSAFEEDDIQHSLEFLNSFASLWNATVHLLFVNISSNFNETDRVMEKMNRFSKSLSVPTQLSTLNAENRETGIRKYAEQVNADMIVLSRCLKNGSILSTSVAGNIINHENRPVMVIGCKN